MGNRKWSAVLALVAFLLVATIVGATVGLLPSRNDGEAVEDDDSSIENQAAGNGEASRMVCSSARPLIESWDNIFSPTALANVLSGIESRTERHYHVIDRQHPPRSTAESALLSILSQLNDDDSQYVEYWMRKLPVTFGAHRDIDEMKIGKQRCPKHGHVLYVNVEGEFGSPTLLWDEVEGVGPGPPGELKSVWAVPSVSNRLLRFNGSSLHAVAYPPLSYLVDSEVGSSDDDDDLVGKRAVILFNTWDKPPTPSDDTNEGAVLRLGTMPSDQEIMQYKEVNEQATVCQDIGHWRPISTTMLKDDPEQECIDKDKTKSAVLSVPLLGSYPRHGHKSGTLKMRVNSYQAEKAFTSRYNIYGVQQSGPTLQEDTGDDMTWIDLLHETLSVLVTGAGSSEVNGCYLFKGRNGNAWEFELGNGDGRTFEMFKVKGTGWWNIMERVRDSHPNPVHYGVESNSNAVLPPTDGWGSIKHKEYWLGMSPMPKIEVTSGTTCSSWKEASSSLIF